MLHYIVSYDPRRCQVMDAELVEAKSERAPDRSLSLSLYIYIYQFIMCIYIYT